MVSTLSIGACSRLVPDDPDRRSLLVEKRGVESHRQTGNRKPLKLLSSYLFAVGVPLVTIAAVRLAGNGLELQPLLLLGVLLGAWLGGLRSALLATGLAALVFLDSLRVGDGLQLGLGEPDLHSFAAFLLAALAVNGFSLWRRHEEHGLTREHTRQSALHHNAVTLLRSADVEAVAQLTVSQCLRVSEAHAGFLWVSEETGSATVMGAIGCDPRTAEAWSNHAGSPLAHAFFTQRVLLLHDRAGLERHYAEFAAAAGSELQAMAVFPLRARGRRHGVLCLVFDAQQAFRREIVTLLTAYADQAGEALDRCRALALADRQSHEFNIISDASLAFSESEIEETPVLDTLAEVCQRHLADSAAAYRLAEGRYLECVAHRERNGGEPSGKGRMTGSRLALGQGLGGLVAATGRGRLIHMRPREFLDGQSADEGSESQNGCSALSVPITARGRVLGVLTLERLGPPSFNQTHALIAQELARRAGLALVAAAERADARQELERRLRVEEVLRENQARLESALAAKDEFLGLVSHELRTPLTLVRGNADILRRYPDMDQDLRSEAFADLSAGAERLGRIVDNMLLLARLEAGRQPELEPVLLQRTIAQARDEFLREAPKADIRLKSRDGEIIVAGNEDYIRQVLHNLFSNAVKYSPPGQPIDVWLRREDSVAVVEVADRGVGVKTESVEELFKPFHREGSQNTQIPGLGIGLTVCKRLIEVQGGSIEAYPRDTGGSVFSFSLTLWPEEGLPG